MVATDSEAQRLARLEAYGGYLDVIESQLLKEIASRSDHFFEAAGVVQVGSPSLPEKLGRCYGPVWVLPELIAALPLLLLLLWRRARQQLGPLPAVPPIVAWSMSDSTASLLL